MVEPTPIGIWEWRVPANTAWWSHEIYEYLELESTVTPSFQAWADRIAPEDRSRVLAGFSSALDRSDVWRDEYRLRTPSRAITVHDCAYILRDEAGNPTRMLGSLVTAPSTGALHDSALKSVGEAAHDLNNMLAVISMSTRLLEKARPGDARTDQLELIRVATERAKAIVSRLRTIVE
jgi:signal transduction histidine kinase